MIHSVFYSSRSINLEEVGLIVYSYLAGWLAGYGPSGPGPYFLLAYVLSSAHEKIYTMKHYEDSIISSSCMQLKAQDSETSVG